MPAIIAALWGGLAMVIGTLVGRILVSLGISYVTYSGVSTLLDWAKAQFVSGMSGLPADAVGMAYLMKVDVCVSMLLSAITARLILAGLSSGGKLTKMSVKSA